MQNKRLDLQGHRALSRRLVAAALRQLRLIELVDWLRYVVLRLRTSSANHAFRRQYPDFPTPPSHLAYDAFGSINWHGYRAGGERVAQRIGLLVAAYLGYRPANYLDWGCGPGAVIRHIPQVLGSDVKVIGTDYNPETIAWCRQALKGIQFEQNNLAPPLTFADSTFDCVCAHSVLTHLSEEMCRSWLVELARVTLDGGIVILTTKGDFHGYRLSPRERQHLSEGHAVFRGGAREGKRMYDTILPKAYVESILPASLDVALYSPSAMPESRQDLWVLRKRPMGGAGGAAN